MLLPTAAPCKRLLSVAESGVRKGWLALHLVFSSNLGIYLHVSFLYLPLQPLLPVKPAASPLSNRSWGAVCSPINLSVSTYQHP